jgi:general secretion pathway protein A
MTERGLVLYLQFFGLNEAPFSITPDPAFVYLSAAHRDALAHLLYGVGQGGAGGFVQLTGEVGTGKTTLCRCLLEQVPEETQVALILNPLVTPRELLATLCEELGIETDGIADSNKAMVDSLNRYLLDQHAKGRRVVVVIDEAQNLSPEALEQVRLLTNLETTKNKLLQMVLLGQPELRALLQRQSLRQLSQRITARYHLAPLGPEETHAYVRHRMKVAGATHIPFRRSALRALYQRSAGVPRLINIIADRALVGAYAKESRNIGSRLVHAAANEVQPSEARVRSGRLGWVLSTASVAVLALVTLAIWGLPNISQNRFPAGSEPHQEVRSGQPAVAVAPAAAPVGNESRGEVTTPVADAVGGVRQELPLVDEPTVPEPIARDPIANEPAASESVATDAVAGDTFIAESAILASSLSGDWLDSQHARAWKAMAVLWQDPESVDDIQLACDGVQGRGYSCWRHNGSWARVQQLGLPVLLVLQDDDTRYLLLRGMNGDELLVGEEQSSIEVSRTALESRWLGEFIVPWPQAPDWPSQIRRGESGKAVDIIMEMASLAEPAWLGEGVFDQRFESWLMAFQRRHGLKDDGIVGPNTLLYLMAPTISQPRLIITAEDGS